VAEHTAAPARGERHQRHEGAFNGVPSLSVLDGWWIEGCIEGVTGWAIGDSATAHNSSDAISLYEKLEQVVLPLYTTRAPSNGLR